MIPTATYRVQLHEKFRLSDLAGILDYLHELGISTVYASPVTTALRGSQHGYDVTDPLRFNPEIGTEEEWEAMASRLRGYGMNWLQDIVPNHMAYSAENLWLEDVMERGKVSPYYSFFDLHPEPVELLGERIMAPFLGGTMTECLQKGELSLRWTARGFAIRYFGQDWPAAVHLYIWVCTLAGDCPQELERLLEELVIASLSPVKEWKAAKRDFEKRVGDNETLVSFLQRRADFVSERVHLMETLLEGQHFALTHHRLSSKVMNYRRFFTVNSLICLRMEDAAVFEAYHQKIFDWYDRGLIQGLRIDHIDGLAAPRDYFVRVRQRIGRDGYMIAEKILARDEALRESWDIQGTTGYEFLAAAGQVLTDTVGSRELLKWYVEEVIRLPDWPDLVTERKHAFLRSYMGGELDNLFGSLLSLGPGPAGLRLREALAILLACWPVYRLYPEEGFNTADKMTMAAAFDRAKRNRPDCRGELDWLEGLFGSPDARPFLSRMMQFTGPLAAKGIEDTSFYIYNPHIAHCEVGDSPSVSGITAEAFHRSMRERLSQWPHSLNATTTHDTKRGEDARIRLNLLSAQPQEWIAAVRVWREMNASLVAWSGERRAPSANDEYLIYQSLLGGWPEDGLVTDEFRERFSGYLRKALREAKAETNYDDPDEWYERSCQAFAAALLKEGADRRPGIGLATEFGRDFWTFAAPVIRESYGFGLAQVLLKLTTPGVPDIYQGAECWETSFVDPDNRRAVDYGHRLGLLREIKAREGLGLAAALGFVFDHPEKGAIKMWVIYRALNFRKAHAGLFSFGEYIPVATEGAALGFIRRYRGMWVLVLVPLICRETRAVAMHTAADLTVAGFRIALPKGAPDLWTELFTGDVHHLADGTLSWPGWQRFPVGMLVAG